MACSATASVSSGTTPRSGRWPTCECSVYERLERLAPTGLHGFHRGDLLARVVRDVDALQDVGLRVLPPWWHRGVVGCGDHRRARGCSFPSAAVAGRGRAAPRRDRASPGSRDVLARQTEAEKAPARGELTASVVDLLEGAPDLVAFGATDAQVPARDRATTRAHARAAASSARTAGVGAGLAVAAASGMATWVALVLGVAAVHAGRLERRDARGRRARPARRVRAGGTACPSPRRRSRGRAALRHGSHLVMLDAPVAGGRAGRPGPTVGRRHGTSLRIRGLRGAHTPTARGRSTASTSTSSRVAASPSSAPSGAGKSTLAAVLVRFVDYESGSVRLDGVELRDLAGDQVRDVVGLVEQDAHIFDSTLRENLRLAQPDASDAELLSAALAARPAVDWVDERSRSASTLPSASTARRCRAASASGSRSPARCSPTSRSSSLDEPGEHLDAQTADALIADLLAATSGRTTLLITHRLAGLEWDRRDRGARPGTRRRPHGAIETAPQ